VFAEKYLIDNLRMLCLRKLHADLRGFDLTLQTSGLVLQVLEFTYTQTERKESRGDKLQRTGETASDFVWRISVHSAASAVLLGWHQAHE
jgi:hypothetical protein